jgi:hypothetical protein
LELIQQMYKKHVHASWDTHSLYNLNYYSQIKHSVFFI